MSYYPIHPQFLPPSPFRQTLVSIEKTDRESTLPFTLSALSSSHYNDWTSMSKPHTSAFTVKCIPVHRSQLSSTGQSSSAPLVSRLAHAEPCALISYPLPFHSYILADYTTAGNREEGCCVMLISVYSSTFLFLS